MTGSSPTTIRCQKEYGLDNGKEFPGSRRRPQRRRRSASCASTTRTRSSFSVAVPIQRFRAVLGALVLSTTGGEIDNVLRAERHDRALHLRLRGAGHHSALGVSRRHHRRADPPPRRLPPSGCGAASTSASRFPISPQRRDEIGHLSGALRDMTTALYNRIDAIEAFAADVCHELKNPLTSLRSAVETLAIRQDRGAARPPGRDRQGRRAPPRPPHHRHLRCLAARCRTGPRRSQPVDVAELLEALVSLANETRKANQAAIKLEDSAAARRRSTAIGPSSSSAMTIAWARWCAISSTMPAPSRRRDSTIRVRVRRVPSDVEFRVEDEGPGIRPDNLERIFERFYTDRPEGSFGKNSGLGLSISRQIVEAHKGRIWAENRYGKAAGGRRTAGPRRALHRAHAGRSRRLDAAEEA